ncbi:MAG: hypothetical protein DWG76_02140 [Chloroflexi bacterium]|nr:hypothetical protein [Chloroflexota bacterium]
MQTARKFQIAFIVLVAVFLIYAGTYIFRSSFVVEGERYFVLNDDAMISMRYAHNLVRGEGAVWNAGERVEGYSNPVWMLYMAFWHLLPISLSKMSLPIQITGALLLATNLVFARRIALLLTKNEWIALGAATMTAFYGPLNNWGLLGMEVSALVLMVSIATWWTLKAAGDGRFDYRPYILLAVGTLVRMDMAVPFLTLLGINLWLDKAHRSQHLKFGFGWLAAGLGLQTILRLAYYGEWLPNTYYLKVTGMPLLVRVGNGLIALFKLVWNTGWLLALLPFSALLYRRERATLTLLALFADQVAYSVYVGGDAWEHKGGANRYISLAMPLFFILLTTAASTLIEKLATLRDGKRLPAQNLKHGLLIAFVLLTLVQVNSTLSTDLSITCCPLRISLFTSSGYRSNIDFTVANEEYVRIARALNHMSTPEASIAVVAAGAIPYFSDLPAIDLLGKSDAVIARTESHLPQAPLARLTSFRPGHSKWDYSYSLGVLHPDIVVQLWEDADQAQEFLHEYVTVEIDGFQFTARQDSPQILWDQVTIIDE